MILVTGASGFLGSHLVRHLSSSGKQVRALYNSHQPTEELKALANTEWLKGDLLDVYEVEQLMQGVHEIYHCAAIVSFDPARKDEMLHFNAESTANIVNQALLQEVRKMIHVSSVAAIGRSGDEKKEITEEEEWGESKYNSAYSISKYMAEMEVWRGMGEGLNAAIVNPGIILGPGTGNDLSNQLIKMVYKGFPFYAKGINAWVDVADVVKAMTMLMPSQVKDERYILSAGNYSYKDIFTMMAEALGKKPPSIYASPFMTNIAWRLIALKKATIGSEAIITRETANNSNTISIYNNQKFVTAFPDFSYTPMESTIKLMAQSFINSYKK